MTYTTVEEADEHYADRPHAETSFPVWSVLNDEQKATTLEQATALIDSTFAPGRRQLVASDVGASYYVIPPTWTGAPVDVQQERAWPRSGMFNRNGRAIPENVIPVELVVATAELAFALTVSDRLLDNDVAVSGIESLRAGPVAITFSGAASALNVIPAAVRALLVPSWFTDERVEAAQALVFTGAR